MNVLIEPRLVDPQAGIGEQPVAVEPLDVVALERAAVTPDVDVVFLHRADEHRAGHGAADRRGIEIRHAGGRDVERAALQNGEPLGRPAARGNRSGALSRRHTAAPAAGSRRSRVRRAGRDWRCRRTGSRPCPHPVQRRAGVEPAGKRNADFLAGGEMLEDIGHRENPTLHHIRPDASTRPALSRAAASQSRGVEQTSPGTRRGCRTSRESSMASAPACSRARRRYEILPTTASRSGPTTSCRR